LKILHVITGLGCGGAENVLLKLIKHDKNNIHYVFCLTKQTCLKHLYMQAGASLYYFDFKNIFLFPYYSYNLVQHLKKISPNIIQTWMYHSDLFGGLLGRIAGFKNIIWGIRHSNFHLKNTPTTLKLIVKLSAILSYIIPKKITVCAKSAYVYHTKVGYDHEKMVLIPNGFDLNYFKPTAQKSKSISTKKIIPKKKMVIGFVGRFHPQKDHKTLLDGLMLAKQKGIPFKCIFVGNDNTKKNIHLVKMIKERKLFECIKLSGVRYNMPKVMNSFDLLILASLYGEGFPNVVAESMACATPCVVTNVGDSSSIVGNTGWVIPPGNAFLLSQQIGLAFTEKYTKKWKIRCANARNRIKSNFSIQKMVKRFNVVWNLVAENNPKIQRTKSI